MTITPHKMVRVIPVDMQAYRVDWLALDALEC
jgi:hypothetical protein